MKTISTLLLSVFVFSVSSQKMASFTVVVTDFENTPLKGEQILMIGNKTNKIFKGVTNASGTFDIDIPGGDIYSINIKSVGEALEYNTMEIPTIGENQFYNKGSLTIMIEQPKLFTLNNVHFDSGKSTIKPSSYNELKELAAFLKLKPTAKIEIGGHTDNVGEEQANKTLSQERANAVRKYLIETGINPQRLTTRGYGESIPVANNNTEKGKQLNRRTEVKIL